MKLKIGDKVITRKSPSDLDRRGTIIDIKMKNGCVHFYSIKNENDGSFAGWNIFPKYEKIKLDISRMRDNKLEQLGI